jgi:hypothetical protein
MMPQAIANTSTIMIDEPLGTAVPLPNNAATVGTYIPIAYKAMHPGTK